MTLVLRFTAVFFAALWLPHIESMWRWPFFVLFIAVLCDLLWRGLRREG